MATAFPYGLHHRIFWDQVGVPRGTFYSVSLLREYIATEYGMALVNGTSCWDSIRRGKLLVERLARLAGITPAEAMKDVQLTYEVRS